MFDFKLFKSSVEKIKSQIGTLKQELEAKKRRREDLDTLPLCKSDRIAMMEAWVDRTAAAYPAALQGALDRVFASPSIPVPADGVTLMDILTVTPHVGTTGSPAHLQKALFFFFPEHFKVGFRKAIEAMPAIENAGPPLAERNAERKKLDAQIQSLERDLSELISSASDAGLAIQ